MNDYSQDDIWQATMAYYAGRDTCKDREILMQSSPGFNHLPSCECRDQRDNYGGLYGSGLFQWPW